MHLLDFLCLVEHQICRVVLPAWEGEEGAPPQSLRGLRDDAEHRLLNLTRETNPGTNRSETPPTGHNGMSFFFSSLVTTHEANREIYQMRCFSCGGCLRITYLLIISLCFVSIPSTYLDTVITSVYSTVPEDVMVLCKVQKIWSRFVIWKKNNLWTVS